MLIINADDWGRSATETNLAMECSSRGRITSVTAMVFMEDSERAASLATQADMTVGLHLNLCEPFTGANLPGRLLEYHRRIFRFLRASRYPALLYNPFLRRQFRYVYQAQSEEFSRLYGGEPSHVDGHHHMHLCANILLDNVIPRAKKVRRNFSFWPGEKSLPNRIWRSVSDRFLTRRYRSTDYFFCLSKVLEADKLDRVLQLARKTVVELMVHPIRAHEYEWLMSERCVAALRQVQIGTYAAL